MWLAAALCAAVIGTEVAFGAELPSPLAIRAQRSHDWVFHYLDRNRNDAVDPSEMETMPTPMRHWMRANGHDLKLSISRSTFLEIAPDMMDAVRRERSRRVGYRYPSSPFVFGRFNRSDLLPAKYRRRDSDRDGQIGLYEWDLRDAKKFVAMDTNGDGFLTPQELGGSPVPIRKVKQPASKMVQRAYGGRAASVFRMADVDHDGLVSLQEWAKVRTGSRSGAVTGSVGRFPLSQNEFSDFYIGMSSPADH